MTTTIDLRGRTFGRLTPIEKAPPRKGRSMWLCLCECGNKTTVRAEHLKEGRSTSCGCFSKESHFKHGKTDTREYISWQSMKDRCLNSKCKQFYLYGARGITICDRWINSFEDFLADMGHRPKNTSIDRRDNEGNYEPGNCRWATPLQQVYNRRNTLFATVGGIRKPVKKWCEELKIASYVVARRRIRRGVPPDMAVTVKGHGLRGTPYHA